MNKFKMTLFATVMFSKTVMAQYGEGYYFDPERTYYVWRFYGYTNYGSAFTEDYYLYDGFENDGKTYRMVLEEGDSKGGAPFSGGELKTMIGIREENGRVMVNREEYLGLMADNMTWGRLGNKQYIPYRQTNDGELVLYDYNMQPGDKYPTVEGHEDVSVVSVGNRTTRDGVSRRLITLSNGCIILEGIGCINSLGLFFFYLNPAQDANVYISYGLYQFIRRKGKNLDVEVIYQRGDAPLGITDTYHAMPPALYAYDLQGRRVTGTPRPGIYIYEGRKRVVR